eukprot:scaffold86_cov338-Pavlova_lutheri.AAC.89
MSFSPLAWVLVAPFGFNKCTFERLVYLLCFGPAALVKKRWVLSPTLLMRRRTKSEYECHTAAHHEATQLRSKNIRVPFPCIEGFRVIVERVAL